MKFTGSLRRLLNLHQSNDMNLNLSLNHIREESVNKHFDLVLNLQASGGIWELVDASRTIWGLLGASGTFSDPG